MSDTIPRKLAVFYHVAHLGSWLAVDAQITAALTTSGLLDAADVFIRNDCTNVELFELPTINMLRTFSLDHGNYDVLYVHTKGVTQRRPCIDDWRACMLYWTVERWRECVEKLHAGYDAVGISRMENPLPHFQGNFWWATTDHLRHLQPVQRVVYKPSWPNQGERHKAEFWVIGTGGKAYSPYHHKINPYAVRNPRASYVGRKF